MFCPFFFVLFHLFSRPGQAEKKIGAGLSNGPCLVSPSPTPCSAPRWRWPFQFKRPIHNIYPVQAPFHRGLEYSHFASQGNCGSISCVELQHATLRILQHTRIVNPMRASVAKHQHILLNRTRAPCPSARAHAHTSFVEIQDVHLDFDVWGQQFGRF